MKHTELFKVKAHDGYMLDVKIDYPTNTRGIIILCHGTGANTYDNRREIEGNCFNYYDLFAEEFCKRDVAFCRWNTRGCSMSDNPPEFVDINLEEYATYCPSTSIKDILAVLDFVNTLPKFAQAKRIFMGISEGARLIPFAATQYKNIDGMLLMGFSYKNMKETLEWQLSGGSSMVNMCKFFDCSEKGYIEKEDFIIDKFKVRPTLFPNTEFEDLDVDKDGRITQNDFAIQLSEYKAQLFEAIESDNDEWLRDNYEVLITSRWCKEHFALPNILDVMCKLSMPIYMFHGEEDGNIPITDIERFRTDFEKAGKSNLNIFTFAKHNHDLNYLQYPFQGIISEGLSCIFNSVQNIL